MENKTPTGLAVKCDKCYLIEFMENESKKAFRARLLKAGWTKENGKDYCGKCSPQKES